MKIIIADEMEKEVVEEIRKLGSVLYKPANLSLVISDADVLIIRSATKVTRELLNHSKHLKLIARGGVGLDNVDQDAAREKGIKVVNTPGASTNAVAELALGHILSCARGIAKANHQMKNGKWEKKSLVGFELEGKTLGIIGYGRIGASLGKKAHGLGMKIISYSPAPRYEDGIVEYVDDISDLFSRSDFISIHAALTQSTRNLINATNLSKMKPGVFIINAARGEIIDDAALYDAVKSGKVAGAALDVYHEEPYKGKLLELENVYFTPHIGASTKEAQAKIGVELVKILKEEFAKKN